MHGDSETPFPAGPESVDPRTLGTMLVNSTVIALAEMRHGRIVFANPAFLAMFHADDSLAGFSLADIVVDAEDDRLVEALAAAEHAPIRYSGIGRRGNDPPFDLEMSLECTVLDGEPPIVVLAWDVTEQHHSREQLAYLAYTDSLTGLANRALFADRLHQAVRTRTEPRHRVRRAHGGPRWLQGGQ